MKKTGALLIIIPFFSGCFLFNSLFNDSYEPDDTRDQAKEILVDDTQYHSISDFGSDVDWVQFAAYSGYSYTITVAWDDTAMDMDFEVYIGSVLLDTRATAFNPEIYQFNCTNNDFYYLKAYESGGDQGGNYTIKITRTLY